jgi:hypothetical protein
MAESSGNTAAVSPNSSNGSRDYGLFQVSVLYHTMDHEFEPSPFFSVLINAQHTSETESFSLSIQYFNYPSINTTNIIKITIFIC